MLMGRLLIGDGEEGKLVRHRPGDGRGGPGRILTSARGPVGSTPPQSGRYAIAVSSDANTAHVFDGGIYMEAHGDHFDLSRGGHTQAPNRPERATGQFTCT